jgi:phosphatidylserine/phosphatidylglycerophosphate/cardiolipin synthase-like enzyme
MSCSEDVHNFNSPEGVPMMSTPGVGIAFSNNDVGLVAWYYDSKIKDCLGFAVYRNDVQTKERMALPAWVGFKGESNKEWKAKTTEVWPVQKFIWRDLTAQRGHSYFYEIVPMVGKPNALKPLNGQTITTNQIQLSPACGKISAFFNRGILSTQSLAHQLPQDNEGKPQYDVLIGRINQPDDPLRNRLAGESINALESLLNRARDEGGKCYCALYELNDPELLRTLLNAPFAHIILSNTGTDDATNKASRQALHEAGIDVMDRMLANGHIGHNKFVLYVDKNGKPTAVLSGSTNWTYTGLCAQSNNALIIESEEIAQHYMDYWNRLKDDDAEQDATLRKSNMEVFEGTVDKSTARIWFSPNTRQKSKPAKNPPMPNDMKDVFEVMDGAKEAIIFLAFQPGTPSIIDHAGKCHKANPELFIRGAVTDPKAVGQFNVDLYHRSGVKPDGTVVAASAINDQFAYWQKELLKSSPDAHAIIHDKIVVVDPLSSHSYVITGSHNLGYRASYNNDENMLIIPGDSMLAKAYTVHVMDVYDHYRWRYSLQTNKKNAWSGLQVNDAWQDKYFQEGTPARKEMEFWCGIHS